MLPPVVIGIGFRKPGEENGLRVWIPFVLLWPVVLLLALLTVAVTIPVLTVAVPLGYGRPVALAVPCLLRVMCSLRGLRIEASGRAGDVYLTFW